MSSTNSVDGVAIEMPLEREPALMVTDKLVVAKGSGGGTCRLIPTGLYPQLRGIGKQVCVPPPLRPLQLPTADLDSYLDVACRFSSYLEQGDLPTLFDLLAVLLNDLALSPDWQSGGDGSCAVGECWYAATGAAHYGRRSVELACFSPLVPCSLGLASTGGNRHSVGAAFLFDVHYHESGYEGAYLPFADMPLECHAEILRELVRLPRADRFATAEYGRGTAAHRCAILLREMRRLGPEHEDRMRVLSALLVPAWHRVYFTMMSNLCEALIGLRERCEVASQLLGRSDSELERFGVFAEALFQVGPLVMRGFEALRAGLLLHGHGHAPDRRLAPQLFPPRPPPQPHTEASKRWHRSMRERGCAGCGEPFAIGEGDCEVLADHTGRLATFERLRYGRASTVRLLLEAVDCAERLLAAFLRREDVWTGAPGGVALPKGIESSRLLVEEQLWQSPSFPVDMSPANFVECVDSSERAVLLHFEETKNAMIDPDAYSPHTVFAASHARGRIPLHLARSPCYADLFHAAFIANSELRNPGFLGRETSFLFDVWDDTHSELNDGAFVKNTSYTFRTNVLVRIATPIAALDAQQWELLNLSPNSSLDAVFNKLALSFLVSVSPHTQRLVSAKGGSLDERLEQVLDAEWVLLGIGSEFVWLPGGAQALPQWCTDTLEALQTGRGAFASRARAAQASLPTKLRAIARHLELPSGLGAKSVLERANQRANLEPRGGPCAQADRLVREFGLRDAASDAASDADFDAAVRRVQKCLRAASVRVAATFDAAVNVAADEATTFATAFLEHEVRPSAARLDADAEFLLQASSTARSAQRYLEQLSPTAIENFVGARETMWYCLWGLYGAGPHWSSTPQGVYSSDNGPDFPAHRDEDFYSTGPPPSLEAYTAVQELCRRLLGVFASKGFVDSNVCRWCRVPVMLDLTDHPAPLPVACKPEELDADFENPHPLPRWACACTRKPRRGTFQREYFRNTFPKADSLDFSAALNQYYPAEGIELPKARFLPEEPVLVAKLKEAFWEHLSFRAYLREYANQMPSNEHFQIVARCARRVLPRPLTMDDVRFAPGDPAVRLEHVFLKETTQLGLGWSPIEHVPGKPRWADPGVSRRHLELLVQAVNTMRIYALSSSTCRLCGHHVKQPFEIPTPENVPGLAAQRPCNPFKWRCFGLRPPPGAEGALNFSPYRFFTVEGCKKFEEAEWIFAECLGAVVFLSGEDIQLNIGVAEWNMGLCFKFENRYFVPLETLGSTNEAWIEWKRYEWERVWHAPTIRHEISSRVGERLAMVPGFLCCGLLHRHRCSVCERVGAPDKGAIVFLPGH